MVAPRQMGLKEKNMIPRDTSGLTHRQKGTEGTNGVPMNGRLPKLAGRFLVVLYYGTGRQSGSTMVRGRCIGVCRLRFTVNDKNSVSTGRNGSKNGYAKNTAFDDVGIFFILLCELRYLGVLFYDLSGKNNS